jgi:hypothetical protein
VLNGATMVPLVMSTFGKLGPAAEGYLQNLASVACSTGVLDRGVWLRISRQYWSCALVRGRGIVFRHYYRSLAKKKYSIVVALGMCTWSHMWRLDAGGTTGPMVLLI